MARFLLQITEANHDENEFFTLGGAGFDTEAERAANLSRIPRIDPSHSCEDPAVPRCYIVDVLDPDGFSIVDNIEVSEQTAHELLGVDDFEPLRAGERAMFAALAAVS